MRLRNRKGRRSVMDIEQVKEKIAEIIGECKRNYITNNFIYADQILAIEVGGEVVEECRLGKNWRETICATNCSGCEYLVCDNRDFDCVVEGKITRPKTLRDVIK
jgi:hypothetical protein